MTELFNAMRPLNTRELRWCELQVISWRQLERKLCKDYTTNALSLLFLYESQTRQRPIVMKRILQRYFKQLKDESMKDWLNNLPRPVAPQPLHPDIEVPLCAKKSSSDTCVNRSRTEAEKLSS